MRRTLTNNFIDVKTVPKKNKSALVQNIFGFFSRKPKANPKLSLE